MAKCANRSRSFRLIAMVATLTLTACSHSAPKTGGANAVKVTMANDGGKDTSALDNTSGNVGGIGVPAGGQFVGLCTNPKPIPPATTVTFPNGDCGG